MTITIEENEVPSGVWAVDPSHSELGFTVRHAGISKVRGKFNDFEVKVVADEDFSNVSIEATAQAASFDSGDANRDGHVKSGDFFDVENFPVLTFKSTKLTRKDDNEFKLEGDLTIKGVTQRVVFDVEVNGVAKDPFGNLRAGLEAKTVISRKEFGLTWNAVLETGGVLVSDKVNINLDLSFIHS